MAPAAVNTPNLAAPAATPAPAIPAPITITPPTSLTTSVSSESSSSSTGNDSIIRATDQKTQLESDTQLELKNQVEIDNFMDKIRKDQCGSSLNMAQIWDSEDLMLAYKAVEGNKSITHLTVKCAGKETFPAIGAMLAKNTTITHVDLSEVRCKAEGWKYIIEGIAQSKSIKTVDCSENPSFVAFEGRALFGQLILKRPKNSVELILQKKIRKPIRDLLDLPYECSDPLAKAVPAWIHVVLGREYIPPVPLSLTYDAFFDKVHRASHKR